jgi:hypothetical protein
LNDLRILCLALTRLEDGCREDLYNDASWVASLDIPMDIFLWAALMGNRIITEGLSGSMAA